VASQRKLDPSGVWSGSHKLVFQILNPLLSVEWVQIDIGGFVRRQNVGYTSD